MAGFRWRVVEVELDPVVGHEQAGRRPALVVSLEPLHRAGLFTVLPITSARQSPRLPGDVPIEPGIGPLRRPSIIIGSQPRTVARNRLSRRSLQPRAQGHVTDPALRERVRDALAHHFGLDLRPTLDGSSGDSRFQAG